MAAKVFGPLAAANINVDMIVQNIGAFFGMIVFSKLAAIYGRKIIFAAGFLALTLAAHAAVTEGTIIPGTNVALGLLDWASLLLLGLMITATGSTINFNGSSAQAVSATGAAPNWPHAFVRLDLPPAELVFSLTTGNVQFAGGSLLLAGSHWMLRFRKLWLSGCSGSGMAASWRARRP